MRRKQRQNRPPDDNSGLIQLYGSDSANIDICFVHGLAGDRIRTWDWVDGESKETHSWPVEFLPQDAEADQLNVRILSYGYKSFAPTPEYLTQRTLYRHSQSLLLDLASFRKDCSDRPLIFVGHSLGGIVIKSALIFSSQDKDPNLLALSISTTGIVFLGTPHNETISSLDQLEWPRTIAKIVDLAKVGNQSLVKHLENQSLSLQSRLQPFKALSDDISIVSYYEKIPTTISNIIVPKPSTRSSYGDKIDTIHASHRNMCRFSSRENPDYQKVSRELLRLCHESTKRSRDNWEKRRRTRGEVPIDYIERVQSAEAEEQIPSITGLDDFRIHDSRLPPRNKRFVGRTEELEYLRKALLEQCSLPRSSTCATINLFGPVGMGKTEIAQEFAHSHRDRFTSVFWIPATSRQSIEQGLVGIANTLRQQLHGPSSRMFSQIVDDSSSNAELNKDQLDQTLKAVMEWFQSTENSEWLVVIDGLEHVGDHDIMRCIPRTTCSHGHCIITSRRPIEWNSVQTRQIHPFNSGESFSLLKASTGLSDANAGNTMAAIRELEHNSLVALTEDQRYLITQSVVLEHSCRLLSDDQRQHASQVACESASAAAKSLQELRDEDNSVDASFAECDLASVMSRCYQLIEANIHASHNWEIDLDLMGRICEKQGRTEEAIKYYNLLVSRNGGSVSITRRAKMRLAMTRRASGDDVRAECEELIQSNDDILSESTASMSEEQFLGDEVDIEALKLLKEMAHDQYTPEEELAISRQIAAVQEYRLGHKHPGTLDAVQQLAQDLVEVGFYDEAEANMRRVLLSYENMAGANYIRTTEAYEVLASIRLRQGKYEDANELFNRALHNHLERLGRDHPTTQKCWSQLGQVYDMRGRFEIAGAVYDKCIAVLNTTQGEDHPDVLRVRGYKAENLANRNLYDEAEKELRAMLELMETNKGIHHESDRRRTAMQLVDILKKDASADDATWLANKVQYLEYRYDLDLQRRIGWIY
ncbi:hypothetical protein ABKA04_004476 [Annulohypoxylon sp. FPYF3050]